VLADGGYSNAQAVAQGHQSNLRLNGGDTKSYKIVASRQGGRHFSTLISS